MHVTKCHDHSIPERRFDERLAVAGGAIVPRVELVQAL